MGIIKVLVIYSDLKDCAGARLHTRSVQAQKEMAEHDMVNVGSKVQHKLRKFLKRIHIF
jgi:hypothetical protein